jgi:hypothetical protein
MLTNRPAVRALLAAAVAALFVAPTAHAQPAYIFTNVIDSTMDASISGNGLLGIDGATVAIETTEEIFTVANGVRTTIVRIGDSLPDGSIIADLSESQTSLSGDNVAFRARLDNGDLAIFRGAGGPLIEIAREGDMTPEGSTFVRFTQLSASISGTDVVFPAVVSTPQGQRSGIYVGNGAGLTTIAKQFDPSPLGMFNSLEFSFPVIHENRIAFLGPSFGGTAVFLSEGGVLTTVAKEGDVLPSGTLASINSPRISQTAVAFDATLGGADAVIAWNGSQITTVAKDGQSGQATGVLTDVGIGGVDNHGNVVFNTGTWGAVISKGGVISPVIYEGDALFGQTLTILRHTRLAIDRAGSGRVAFGYELANGVRGIAIATPVPEPAAGATLAIAALAAARTRRSRRATPS